MDEYFLQCLERGCGSQSNSLRNSMFEIWDGDVFLFAVDSQHEADEQQQQGFQVVVAE